MLSPLPVAQRRDLFMLRLITKQLTQLRASDRRRFAFRRTVFPGSFYREMKIKAEDQVDYALQNPTTEVLLSNMIIHDGNNDVGP